MAERLKLLLDSSAWINILRIVPPWTPASVEQLISSRDILVADLILVEVVRGAKSKPESNLLLAKLSNFDCVSISNVDIARKAIENHQRLQSKGITIRGTVDLFIATWCIENDIPLVHADRDFDGFEQHLGLKVWRG